MSKLRISTSVLAIAAGSVVLAPVGNASAARGDIAVVQSVHSTDMAYAQAATHLADLYLASTGVHAPKWAIVQLGEKVSGACGPSDDQAYEYCPDDGTATIGLGALHDMRGQWKYGPLEATIHETGHEREALAGSQILSEDEADCTAGAGMSWLNRQYGLGLPSKLSYIGEETKFIHWSARPDNEPGYDDPHGTYAERMEAMQRGYSQGLKACNFYDGPHPIA